MRVVLVPVTIHTGQQELMNALCKAIDLYRREAARIHLLSVQPVFSAHVSECLPAGELHQIQKEAAQDALRPAKEILAAAEVPFYTHVEIGRSAQTIVRISRTFQCDSILMGGQPAPDGVAQKLFGSLASQVRHLLDSVSGGTVTIF